MSFIDLLFTLSWILSLELASCAPVPQYSLIFNPVLDFSPTITPTLNTKCLLDFYLAGELATASISECIDNEVSRPKGLKTKYTSKDPYTAIDRLMQLKQRQRDTISKNSKSALSQKTELDSLGEPIKQESLDIDEMSQQIEAGFDIALDSVLDKSMALFDYLLG